MSIQIFKLKCYDVVFYLCTHIHFLFVCQQITFFFGTLLNELINKILKHWIKEPRPVDRLHIGEEYGMPSSHSQFIWFFSIYVTLFVLLRYRHFYIFNYLKFYFKILSRLHHMNNNSLPFERAGRLLVVLSCWCMSILVCISRTYLQYHTCSQVIVGSIIGLITGASWFSVTHLILTPLFPYVVSW